MATDAWGIDDGYWDASGRWHATSPETVAALRKAMGGGGAADGPPNGPAAWVVHAGRAEPLLGPCELALEDGSELRAAGELPPDLPIGYHELRPLDGGPVTRLIVTPGRCHLPDELRAWLFTVQLPACRSTASWGIGDLADLRSIGAWSAERGAGMLGVSPMHAPQPVGRVEASPYSPSSRRWFNPLLLRIEELPGAAGATVEALGAQARALNAEPVVDRDAVWVLKRRALDHLWDALGPDLRFERWRAEMGGELEAYARFCALAEHHGSAWRDWPSEHRHPSAAGVVSFAADRAHRVAFWAWVQFLVDGQIQRAEEPLALVTDLAVGVDRHRSCPTPSERSPTSRWPRCGGRRWDTAAACASTT
jgi:4-alpha-glucanotransferase